MNRLRNTRSPPLPSSPPLKRNRNHEPYEIQKSSIENHQSPIPHLSHDLRRVSQRSHPPILHRKETFISPAHPLHDKFAKLTRQEEKAGLFSAKLRKLGLREETIGYGPSKQKWEEWNQERS